MGMATGRAGGRSGRGHGRRGSRVLVSEINVTPFVDVMLVLLIIFMVAAPLLTVGVPIDLPETEAGPISTETQPIIVAVNAQGQIYLQDSEISYDEILPKLQAIASTGYDERILVRGDGNTNYEIISRVMGRISGAGYRNMILLHLPQGN